PATDAPGTPEATAAPVASPSPAPAATAAPQTVAARAATPAAEPELSIAALPRAANRRQGATSALAENEAAVQLGAVDPPPAAPQPSPVPPRATSGRSAGETARIPPPRLWTVVIDPGHGGKDPGAKGVTGDDEKDITLAVAQLVAERLSEDPQIRAVLTRTDDSYVSLEQRTAIANAQGADLFLSIHGNASESPQLAGVETYTLNNTDDRATIRLAALENGLALTGASPGERDLAYILSDLVQTGKEDESVTLARAVQGNLVSYLRDRWRGVVNLGVKKGPFYVLVGAYMPCILVEVAFLSNETEGQRIAARRYQKDVADGIALGVRRFLASDSANANL
ncbi:MAG: N-acetylmuramoyl-L-alanine amidase, partial [Deltaproteobacteria bacterium]|nr:N-acetylmuramoyl-L-alanine amidase [Deltaproteobacteria bacterium]